MPDPMPEMSSYSFGTMSIGGDPYRIHDDIRLARIAMDAGVWFHTCRRYSSVDSFNVLGRAFREDPAHIPPCICKIRCHTADALRIDVEDTLSLLGLETVHVAQLSKRSGERKEIVDDFLSEGPMWQTCHELRERGLVRHFALELFTSCSPEGLTALQRDMFDAYAFYYSVVDREVTNSLFEALMEKGAPIISIRAVGGGKIFPEAVERLRREQPEHYYLGRLAGLEQIFERSGSRDWLDFAFRFFRSQPNILTSIGGTSNEKHLRAYLEAASRAEPLPDNLVQAVHGLQNDWMTGF